MKDDFPEGLLFSKENCWVKVDENDGSALVGVIKKSAEAVNSFVFLDAPEKGSRFREGEPFANLEAVKWTGSLNAPFDMLIIDVNQRVVDDPSLINKEPYKEWVVRVKVENKEGLKGLMNSREAEEYYSK